MPMIEVGEDFVVTEEALAQAKALGITNDATARLKQMVRESAPFSGHPNANRRFDNLMLLCREHHLLAIQRIDYDPVKQRQAAKRRERLERRHNQQAARAEGKQFIDLTRGSDQE